MWRQEDLFFSGLGGGAPTGDPVKSPGELARRVAAGGDGITFFPTPPLMHGTSTLTAFIGFNFGQRVVVHRKFVPEEVLRTIEREKVTSVSLVGDAMLRPLIDCLKGPSRGTDCSSLFSVSSSGAVMSDSVRAEFQALVPTVMLLNNFGSSESGFNGTATADSGPENGFRVRVNARTAVVDPTTHEPVAPGEPGRIAQRGHVPLGYYNDPAKTADTFFHRGGERWVLLGDMATVDVDGIVTVLGRGSQCINTGGEKVYPEEVEQALKSHPDVYDALVAGVPRRAVGQPGRRRGPTARHHRDVEPGGSAGALPEQARRIQDPAGPGAGRPHPALAERQGRLPVGQGGGDGGRTGLRTRAVIRPASDRCDRRTPWRAGNGTRGVENGRRAARGRRPPGQRTPPGRSVRPNSLIAARNSSGRSVWTRCPASMVTDVAPGMARVIRASCSWSM